MASTPPAVTARGNRIEDSKQLLPVNLVSDVWPNNKAKAFRAKGAEGAVSSCCVAVASCKGCPTLKLERGFSLNLEADDKQTVADWLAAFKDVIVNKGAPDSVGVIRLGMGDTFHGYFVDQATNTATRRRVHVWLAELPASYEPGWKKNRNGLYWQFVDDETALASSSSSTLSSAEADAKATEAKEMAERLRVSAERKQLAPTPDVSGPTPPSVSDAAARPTIPITPPSSAPAPADTKTSPTPPSVSDAAPTIPIPIPTTLPSDTKTPSPSSSSSSLLLCDRDKCREQGIAATHYCRDEDRLLCQGCLLLHAASQRHPVQTVAEADQAALVELWAEMDRCSEALRGLDQQIRQMDEPFRAAKAMVERVFEQSVALLQSESQSLVALQATHMAEVKKQAAEADEQTEMLRQGHQRVARLEVQARQVLSPASPTPPLELLRTRRTLLGYKTGASRAELDSALAALREHACSATTTAPKPSSAALKRAIVERVTQQLQAWAVKVD